VLSKKGSKVVASGPVNILERPGTAGAQTCGAGFSSQQIAKQIVVGVKTVETYRSRLAQKLGLRTRSDVVRFAYKWAY
jgi:two-component system response regulator NreC